jgi:hypothetical protein
VDHSGKQQHNFAPNMEDTVRQEIIKRLEKHKAGPGDLAFTAGLSAGSELIFAEVCLQKGIHVGSHLPVSESAYVRDFVTPGGDPWVERFYKVRNHPLSDEMYQVEHVGKPKNGDDLHERNNRWALYSSLLHGVDKVRLIAFWDGKGGRQRDRDARLVRHMVQLMRDTGGLVEHIHASKLMHLPFAGEFGELPIAPTRISKRRSKKK